MTNSFKVIFFSSAMLMLGSSCMENSSKSKQLIKKDQAESTLSTNQSHPLVNSWVDEFENFRKAVLKNDVEKLSAYFNFPLLNDTTQIWTAVYENVPEAKRPKEFKGVLTKDDFKAHYRSVFNEPFSKSLKLVNLQGLRKMNEYTTPEVKDDLSGYHMHASFDQASSVLQLALTYSGELDENGEAISETEHAIIYFFKIKNNHLKFEKILFAG